jgi:hypothetical protein
MYVGGAEKKRQLSTEIHFQNLNFKLVNMWLSFYLFWYVLLCLLLKGCT